MHQSRDLQRSCRGILLAARVTMLVLLLLLPGALFGATANEAFDVIVDDRNNPAGNLENGLVNVQIFVVPVPTLERIEIDLLRVGIGQIQEVQSQLGFLPAQNY